jgi:hypothetical protein
MASARGILTIQSLKNELIEGSRHVASSSAPAYHAGNAQSEYLRWWSGPDLRITPQIIIVDAG